MTNPIANKALFAMLKNITKDEDIPSEFNCLGNIDTVYPEYKTEAYRTWIWEKGDGVRIATWDTGNGYCSFMCEGSLDGIKTYLEAKAQEQRGRVAEVGEIIMFPQDSGFNVIPNLIAWSHRVETVAVEGITLNGFDQVFPHESYIVCS